MASVKAHRGGESMRVSSESDKPDITIEPGFLRRDSSSTTGSGRPIPSGHWTLPISGNCPRCRHHHRSLKVHIRSVENTSKLVDVHCEKCAKLWIGPGSINSTRISLASNETIDPPPKDPEVRSALVHAIRSATRVATLSSTLPDIQEGVAGLSYEPSTHSLTHGRDQLHGESRVDQDPHMTSDPISDALVSNDTAPPPKLIGRVNTNRVNTVRARLLLSRMKRRLESTRLGRLPLVTKLLHEGIFAREPFQNTTSVSGVSPNRTEHRAQVLRSVRDPLSAARSAEALDSQTPLGTITQGTINTMTPEQRIAYLRAQITIFSAQYGTHPEASLRGSSQYSQDEISLAVAIIQDLAGIGYRFDQHAYRDILHDSDTALPRSSLQISETRTSEANTAVEGQTFASDNFLGQILNRVDPLSTESNYNQTQDNGATTRPVSLLTSTIGAQQTAPASSGTPDGSGSAVKTQEQQNNR